MIKNTQSYVMQGDDFGTETTEEDKNIAFRFGYQAVVERRRSLGQVPRSRMPDKVKH